MTSAERFPEFGFDEYRQNGVLALVLNLRSTTEFARALEQTRKIEFERFGYQHKTEKWFELRSAPNRYIPVATQRTILAPETSDGQQAGIDRLVVNVPVATEAPVAYPHDVFVETVEVSGQRTRHILNSTGLWEYGDRGDLAFSPRATETNDLFEVVHGYDATAKVPLLNHMLTDYVPRLQSSDEIERP